MDLHGCGEKRAEVVLRTILKFFANRTQSTLSNLRDKTALRARAGAGAGAEGGVWSLEEAAWQAAGAAVEGDLVMVVGRGNRSGEGGPVLKR